MPQPPKKALQIFNSTQFDQYFNQFDNFYIGSATCHFLLPSLKDFGYLLDKTQKENKMLSLLTPIMPQDAFPHLEKLIKLVEEKQALNFFELIFNDWGVFQDFKDVADLKLICGSFIINQKKDPYYLSLKDQYDATSTMSVANNPDYAEFLLSQGIDTIELENICQGISLKNLEKLKINLHTPYISFSLTRHCPQALIEQGKNFQQIITQCDKYCQNEPKQIWQLKNEHYQSFYRGNWQVYKSQAPLPNNINKIIYNQLLIEPTIS